MSETSWEPGRATFAGSVAVLWLQYVHDLMRIVAVQADRIETAELDKPMPPIFEGFWAMCDRIEGLLRYLETSSMPIPGMTLEDVIELGREVQFERDAEALEERVEDYQDNLGRVRTKVLGGFPPYPEDEQPEPTAETPTIENESPAEPIPTGPDPVAKEVASPAPTSRRQYNLICSKCGNHVRSKVHKKACGGKNPSAFEGELVLGTKPEPAPPKKRYEPVQPSNGTPTRCPKCTGQLFFEDGDRVCLSCGWRRVGGTILEELDARAKEQEPLPDGKRHRAPSIAGMKL